MATEFIASDTGNWTLTGTFTPTNMGHMYNGQVLRAPSLSPFSHSAEFSVTGLDVGEYRLCYWWGNNSNSRDSKITITDGSSTNSVEVIMMLNQNGTIQEIGSPVGQYNGTWWWRESIIGIKCDSGTLNFKVEPEPRMRYTGTWDVPIIAGNIMPSLDGAPDIEPEHTPVSTKSKPHPLSTN